MQQVVSLIKPAAAFEGTGDPRPIATQRLYSSKRMCFSGLEIKETHRGRAVWLVQGRRSMRDGLYVSRCIWAVLLSRSWPPKSDASCRSSTQAPKSEYVGRSATASDRARPWQAVECTRVRVEFQNSKPITSCNTKHAIQLERRKIR